MKITITFDDGFECEAEDIFEHDEIDNIISIQHDKDTPVITRMLTGFESALVRHTLTGWHGYQSDILEAEEEEHAGKN